MISVKVADYCHDCESFSPDLSTFYGDTFEPIHIITCTYANECRHIKLHLEKKLKEKKNNEGISE